MSDLQGNVRVVTVTDGATTSDETRKRWFNNTLMDLHERGYTIIDPGYTKFMLFDPDRPGTTVTLYRPTYEAA